MKYTCYFCLKSYERRPALKGTFCSNRCQQDCQTQRLIILWQEGLEPGWCGQTVQLKSFVRNYMLEKYDYSCVQCGWNERHPVDGKPLVEVDHIDGNAKNCQEENLRVLCPNCHSMTSTFRARNPKSVRRRAG